MKPSMTWAFLVAVLSAGVAYAEEPRCEKLSGDEITALTQKDAEASAKALDAALRELGLRRASLALEVLASDPSQLKGKEGVDYVRAGTTQCFHSGELPAWTFAEDEQHNLWLIDRVPVQGHVTRRFVCGCTLSSNGGACFGGQHGYRIPAGDVYKGHKEVRYRVDPLELQREGLCPGGGPPVPVGGSRPR